jgi:acetyl-CoA C-acetyltransferase
VIDVVVVGAVRTPIGRRNGVLAGIHPADLLGVAQREVLARANVEPDCVELVVGGCVTNVGEQSFNICRTAWLSSGLPYATPAVTVDTHCGSSLQAVSFAAAEIASGSVDVVLACGVESMSRVPLGTDTHSGPGKPLPASYFDRYEFTSQFEAAERVAEKWAITREDADEFAVRSQSRAARAWAEGRFFAEVVPVRVPDTAGDEHIVRRDEGLRATSRAGLATLKPVTRVDGIHTAGNCSQISDGAAAVLLMSSSRAASLGLRPRARIVDHCLVGVDPVLMLTGPMEATRVLLDRSGMAADDIDAYEINEAFASVVLAWHKEFSVDEDSVNPNGGAIALGHPVGSTGTRLVVSAVHELERSGGHTAILSLCCASGLAPGMLIERL